MKISNIPNDHLFKIGNMKYKRIAGLDNTVLKYSSPGVTSRLYKVQNEDGQIMWLEDTEVEPCLMLSDLEIGDKFTFGSDCSGKYIYVGKLENQDKHIANGVDVGGMRGFADTEVYRV